MLWEQGTLERHWRSKNEMSQGRGIVTGDVAEGTALNSITTHSGDKEGTMEKSQNETLWALDKSDKNHCRGGIAMEDVAE